MSGDLARVTRDNVQSMLSLAIEHTPDKAAVVVYDENSGLSKLLANAYRECLPNALHLNFDQVTQEQILAAIGTLQAGDLVVLVQSTAFRLAAFRLRIELFQRGLKAIDHPHVSRMREEEYGVYVDALAYDPSYYRVVGAALKERIDRASQIVVDSGGERLVYGSAFETAKLNTGDYSAMKNVGGQFPIGEVFTEPKDLDAVNGRVRIFVFGDVKFCVNVPEKPITLVIERGKIVGVENSTPDFDNLLQKISADEELWVRELGFGLNRAFSRERMVSDVGAYERMCGVHMSLGAKHSIYDKPHLRRKEGKHHVDVFAVTSSVLIDGEVVYRDGRWTV